MPLRVLVANADGECRELELDDVTLMFFDTLMAALNMAFPDAHHGSNNFDFFEYTDEDGDSLAVRTDQELETFLAELLPQQQATASVAIQLRLRSSRAMLCKQISFDDSADELMLLAPPARTTIASNSSNQMFPNKISENTNNSSNSGGCRYLHHKGAMIKAKVAATVPMNNNNNNNNNNGSSSKSNSNPMASIEPEDLQLVERLSDGQFGTVYKALDVRNDRLLAVKCIAVDNTSGSRQALLNEISIMRNCSHPNIVTFHAALFIENQLLICMELMDALSLDLYGKLPAPVLGAVTVAVVDGLAHLWAHSIMHRDIKPSNFLMNCAGAVKLGDFGVSKQMAQSIAWSYVGTKVYMAPERIGGDVYNVASDVWSLGISLAEMALGRFPFNTHNTVQQPIESLLLFRPERLTALLQDVELAAIGNGFVELLTDCLRLNPRERYGPAKIAASDFLCANRPMNQTAVSEFIRAKRRVTNSGQKSTTD